MINRADNQANRQAPRQPSPPPPPTKAAEPARPMAADELKLRAKPGDGNVFHDSAGRLTFDVVSGASAGAEVAADLRGVAVVAETLGSKIPLLGGLSTRLGRVMHRVADWGGRVAVQMPKAAAVFTKLAKAAPLLGVGVAMLDIGRAVVEKDPKKRQIAEGQAVLSAVSGLGGVLGAGAAAGATAFGLALAPLAVPALVVGVGATALALADTFLFNGAVSTRISQGLRALVP